MWMKKQSQRVFAAIAAVLAFAAVEAHAVLPTYLTSALTDAQTQLTELIAVIAGAAIIITLLVIGPKVVVRMIRSLAGKVSV